MAKLIAILTATAVILAIYIFIIERKLRDGEKQISAGQQKLAANDNLFVQLFFSSKLAEGRQKLSDGRKKLAFAKRIRTLLAILCVACIVGAIAALFKA